jgi:hypothetical protein
MFAGIALPRRWPKAVRQNGCNRCPFCAVLSACQPAEARTELAQGRALAGDAKFQAEEKKRARAALAKL